MDLRMYQVGLRSKFIVPIGAVIFATVLSASAYLSSAFHEKTLLNQLRDSEATEEAVRVELAKTESQEAATQAEVALLKEREANGLLTSREREDAELRIIDLQQSNRPSLYALKEQLEHDSANSQRISGVLADLRSGSTVTIAVVTITSLVVITIALVLGYLRPSDRATKTAPPQAPSSLSDVASDIRRLIAEQIEAHAGFDKNELLSNLRATVTADLAGELQARFKSEALESLAFSLMREMYKSDFERLFDQIALLRKRGNLNLAIGVAITLLAAGILIWATYGANSGFAKLTDVLSYYIPRVSTIAFIEVFAFFFLRLYKSTLAEEKFYQNELTARTARQVALEAALKSQVPGPLAAVITNLSLVDQNKGTTPTGAEAQPSEPMDLGKLLEGVAKIVSAVASKSQA